MAVRLILIVCFLINLISFCSKIIFISHQYHSDLIREINQLNNADLKLFAVT